MAFEITLEITDREALLADLRRSLEVSRATEQTYIYVHGDSASGVCTICAPYGGMVTDGQGSNNVPIPPLHPNCVCALIPIEVDEASAETTGVEMFSYLKSLNKAELSEVVGDVRAALVFANELSIANLYDTTGSIIPLDVLGYSKTGKRLKNWA